MSPELLSCHLIWLSRAASPAVSFTETCCIYVLLCIYQMRATPCSSFRYVICPLICPLINLAEHVAVEIGRPLSELRLLLLVIGDILLETVMPSLSLHPVFPGKRRDASVVKSILRYCVVEHMNHQHEPTAVAYLVRNAIAAEFHAFY